MHRRGHREWILFLDLPVVRIAHRLVYISCLESLSLSFVFLLSPYPSPLSQNAIVSPAARHNTVAFKLSSVSGRHGWDQLVICVGMDVVGERNRPQNPAR